tara:strand:- start:362 stop:529 length:168 start_codon:yes stop_codon:yes gene_type:complete
VLNDENSYSFLDLISFTGDILNDGNIVNASNKIRIDTSVGGSIYSPNILFVLLSV